MPIFEITQGTMNIGSRDYYLSIGHLPTYVTYVEFNGASARPPTSSTTPQRSCISVHTPSQKGVTIRENTAFDGWVIWHSKELNNESAIKHFKLIQ